MEGRAIALDVLREDGPIVELASAGVLTLVPRKKGGYDVGLRDRVLRVKCDADG